jgi:hypothetical protein
MRAATSLGMALAMASATACKWSEFDDLKHQTWASSTGNPDVKSSDWGVAIQRGARGGDGGTLVVIGAGQPTYSQLVYNATGDTTRGPAAVELTTQYGIGTLDAQPIAIADPTSDEVSLIVDAGPGSIAVLAGSTQIALHTVFLQPSAAAAATYMKPPARIDPPHTGEAQPEQPLVASGDYVLGTFYTDPPSPQPTCELTDGGTAISPRALGTAAASGFDDVLAWGASGTLYRYPGSVFNGCATAEPVGSVATMFAPGHGSQILALSGGLVVLQGHHDTDDASVLQVFDAQALTAVGPAVSLPAMRTAAVLDAAGTSYVIAGYPTETVAGVRAGQVRLFAVSAAGLDAAPAVTLHDAQPTDDEAFGRGVAALPFNGTQLVTVAADNQIFTYFEFALADGAKLYDETREGR